MKVRRIHSSPRKDYMMAINLLKEEDKDYERIFKLLERSAFMGYPRSMYRLALMYLNGEGTDEDSGKCLEYMTKAEEEHFVEAIYFMAIEYYIGDLVPQNVEESMKRLKLLSDMGSSSVSELFENVVPDDNIKRIIRRSIFKENKDEHYACMICRRMYEFGLSENDIRATKLMIEDDNFRGILREDMIKASTMISSIARRNDIDLLFMNELFEDYMIGTGSIEPDESIELYIDVSDADDNVRAIIDRADEGDPDAQYEIGMRYRTGTGVYEDGSESVKYLRMAAENGHVEAMYEMGISYELGIGVPIDDYVSEEWFRRAAELGHEESKKIISSGQ